MIAFNRNGGNTAYMDILEAELPKQDLEGATIGHSSNFTLEGLNPGDDASEDFIANVRYQFRV